MWLLWLNLLWCCCDASQELYTDLTYNLMTQRLLELERKHPDILRVTSCQAIEFGGLPALQTCDGPCTQYIAILGPQNMSNLIPPDELPEVFFSGSLHGNERVGPLTLLTTLELLTANHADITRNMHQSKKALRNFSEHEQWLYRLTTMRRSVWVLATNAEGYHHDMRGEPSAGKITQPLSP